MNKEDLLVNGTITVSNGIYKVSVEDDPTLGAGRYTIGTDSGHPAGGNQDIFFGGGYNNPGSTYTTIRSYSTLSDYIQHSDVIYYNTDPGFTIRSLSPSSTTVQTGPTSIRTTYTLTLPSSHDNMIIVQDIIIHGTTIDDSTIEVTTSIKNTGLYQLLLGVRYLWDYKLDNDEGPTFQQLNPNGFPLTTEATFAPAAFESYEMVDNSDSSVIKIRGTVNGPAAIVPVPTPPSKLEYAQWDNSLSAFSYNTTGQSTDWDCMVLYYWGDTEQQPILLLPEETRVFSASLFLPAQAPVPTVGRGIEFWKLA